MNFSRCYFHIIWTTKNRNPLITPEIQELFVKLTKMKCHELECQLFAINTMADHIHIAVSMPPKLAPAHFIKHVKGTSSRNINITFTDLPTQFGWQNSYGILTFGVKNLDFVVNYFKNQQTHHVNQATYADLEQTEGE